MTCWHCAGSGVKQHPKERAKVACPHCRGTGHVPDLPEVDLFGALLLPHRTP